MAWNRGAKPGNSPSKSATETYHNSSATTDLAEHLVRFPPQWSMAAQSKRRICQAQPAHNAFPRFLRVVLSPRKTTVLDEDACGTSSRAYPAFPAFSLGLQRSWPRLGHNHACIRRRSGLDRSFIDGFGQPVYTAPMRNVLRVGSSRLFVPMAGFLDLCCALGDPDPRTFIADQEDAPPPGRIGLSRMLFPSP